MGLSQGYDDLALMRYMTKINDYRYNGETYDSIRKLMDIDNPDEFRAKYPDNFPLASSDDNPDSKKPEKTSPKYPSLADTKELMVKRFALDFHKLLFFKYEQRRSDVTYHTMEIVKSVLNLPAFEEIDIRHEREK